MTDIDLSEQKMDQMTQDTLDEIPESTPDAAAHETAEPVAPQAVAADVPPLTAERVVDITLGLVSVAAEAAGDAIQRMGASAKTLQENAPAIREALEERGRPIREQLVMRLRDTLPTKSTTTGATAEPGVAITSGPPATSSQATPQAADQEISALEQRVRELEQQVSVPVVEPAIVDTQALAPVEIVEAETTAELATFVPDEEPATALADSEYAVSETEEQAEHEESTTTHDEHGAAD